MSNASSDWLALHTASDRAAPAAVAAARAEAALKGGSSRPWRKSRSRSRSKTSSRSRDSGRSMRSITSRFGTRSKEQEQDQEHEKQLGKPQEQALEVSSAIPTLRLRGRCEQPFLHSVRLQGDQEQESRLRTVLRKTRTAVLNTLRTQPFRGPMRRRDGRERTFPLVL